MSPTPLQRPCPVCQRPDSLDHEKGIPFGLVLEQSHQGTGFSQNLPTSTLPISATASALKRGSFMTCTCQPVLRQTGAFFVAVRGNDHQPRQLFAQRNHLAGWTTMPSSAQCKSSSSSTSGGLSSLSACIRAA